jgi:two-component system, LytTR family, sensor histidine kinase AlgZ
LVAKPFAIMTAPLATPMRSEIVESATVLDVVRTTFAALLRPRHSIPVMAVVIPVLSLQVRYSYGSGAATVGALLCAAFALFAPLSWRVLVSEAPGHHGGSLGLPRASSRVLNVAIYLLLSAAVVGCVGVVVPRILQLPQSFMTERGALLSCLALYIVGGGGLGRSITLELAVEREKKRAEAMQLAASHAQLLALKSHLDPHFLFNTLNAIAEWCRTDGVVAERAVLQLSQLLREMMQGIHATEWQLAREVELVRSLFALHAVRDEARFKFDIEVQQGLDAYAITPMLLLPLAENAMKHGPGAGHNGAVTLRIEKVGERLHIVLCNPGAFRGRRAGGAGLSIVERRLDLAHNRRATFHIGSEADVTAARITLPAEQLLAVTEVNNGTM